MKLKSMTLLLLLPALMLTVACGDVPEAIPDIETTVEPMNEATPTHTSTFTATSIATPVSTTAPITTQDRVTPTATAKPIPVPKEPSAKGFTYSLEEIPGSLNHSPDSTWWGYNQSKIARYGDTVFTYVVHNDNDPATKSLMTLYKKVGGGPWEQGASMPCSRPGNILLDSKGGLHALVFDPEDILVNDSLGSLEYYYFLQAGNGDIDTFIHKTVVPAPGDNGNETVNIRIGASIGRDDTIALAFGLGTTEQFYYKKTSDPEWNHSTAGVNLGHNFYYPYPLVTDSGYAILAIQDDYVEIDGQAHNPYHIAAYFQGNEHGWPYEFLLDNTQSPQALTHRQWQTVSISDLYLDTDNTVHVVLQDRVAEEWLHYRKALGDSDWTITTLDAAWKRGVNWIRLIQIKGSLYYIMASWREVAVMDGNVESMVELDLESLTGKNLEGIYPYVASPKTGTNAASEFVDILLLNGSSNAYPNGSNYYLKISKDYILQKFQ